MQSSNYRSYKTRTEPFGLELIIGDEKNDLSKY